MFYHPGLHSTGGGTRAQTLNTIANRAHATRSIRTSDLAACSYAHTDSDQEHPSLTANLWNVFTMSQRLRVVVYEIEECLCVYMELGEAPGKPGVSMKKCVFASAGSSVIPATLCR
jgi:hypothetical protein